MNRSSVNHIFELLLLGSALLLSRLVATAADDELSQPTVYSLIIGVSDYSDGPLTNAATSAIKVANAVQMSYGKTTNLLILTNANATVEKVDEALFGSIGKAPPGSLLVVYFAGHGIRDGLTFRLLLHGATQANYYGKSLLLSSILEALRKAHECTAMVFLDCCFSGGTPPEIQLPDADYKYLDARAFLLASSYTNEPSISGLFTEALLQVWDNIQSNSPCLKPIDLESRVNSIVHDKSSGHMSSGLAFGQGITRCFAELNRPATFLLFRFPNGCAYKLNFYFNDDTNFEVYSPAQHVFYRQVTKQPMRVRVECQGKFIWTNSFSLGDLQNGEIVVNVPIPKEFASSRGDDVAAGALACADVLESYGANDSLLCKYYADALVSERTLTPDHSSSNTIAKLTLHSNGSALSRLAFNKGSASDYKEVVRMQSQSNVIDLIEAVGKYDLAASICQEASSSSASASFIQEFNLSRSLIDYKAAGNLSKAALCFEFLKNRHLTESQSNFLSLVEQISPTELTNSFSVLPRKPLNWLTLGANLSIRPAISTLDASSDSDIFVLDASSPKFSDIASNLTVHFSWDSSEISQKEEAKVDALAQILKNSSNVSVSLKGEADDANWTVRSSSLEQRRELSVANRLLVKGVDSGQIKVVAYGAAFPIDPNGGDSRCVVTFENIKDSTKNTNFLQRFYKFIIP